MVIHTIYSTWYKLYLYQSQRTESLILKLFVCIYLFLKCFQNICAFSVIQMFVFIRIIIKGWMIISVIDISFVARLNKMAEAYFLPDYEHWTVLVENFYVCKFDFNDSFTVLTIIVRKQYILQHQNSQNYWIVQSHPNNYFNCLIILFLQQMLSY